MTRIKVAAQTVEIVVYTDDAKKEIASLKRQVKRLEKEKWDAEGTAFANGSRLAKALDRIEHLEERLKRSTEVNNERWKRIQELGAENKRLRTIIPPEAIMGLIWDDAHKEDADGAGAPQT